LFDEPLSNLDAQLRDQMRLELKVLQDRLGFTAIYVTHDQAEAFALAESVLVMNRGRIETVGPPREVFRRPRTPFVARFLGLNVWRGELLGPTSAGPEGLRYAQVALADGFSLWGVLDDDQAVTAGAPAVACLRKEHIGVRHAGGQPLRAPSPACPEEQTFAGVVRAASFLGLDEEYMIVIAGVELRAVRPASGVASGDAVDVTIKPQDCMIVRATAGRLDE
jgi:ABC-type Fe3+/spermidine/putrescine transport system ATPase subunit